MKILITGSKGMVGSNVAEVLGSDNNFSLLLPTHSELDLFDVQNLEKYLINNKPDLIIHAAGRVGGIQANMQDPLKFFIENLDMGKNIVSVAYKLGIRNFINLGSSCMYPRGYETPLNEELVLKGELEPTNEGYALAKVAIAKYCEYITKMNAGYNYITFIPCNLYGKGDKFDSLNSHMIPNVIRKLHEAKTTNINSVDIWGSGKARREFMYVEDLANVIHKAIYMMDDLPTYMNVGLGYDLSITEYYYAIAQIIGYKGEFVYDLTKPEGMQRKLVDVSLQKSMGLYFETPLEEGLEKTYSYFLEKCR